MVSGVCSRIFSFLATRFARGNCLALLKSAAAQLKRSHSLRRSLCFLVTVHAVLTSEYLLMFSKDGSSGSVTPAGVIDHTSNNREPLMLKGYQNPFNKSMFAPVLSVRRLLTRNVATDKNAFFLVQPEQHSKPLSHVSQLLF